MGKRYIVYIEQVNQTYVEVNAETEAEAKEKGYAKWRREYAHSRVIAAEEIEPAESGGKDGE
jgi:hypothetical protein